MDALRPEDSLDIDRFLDLEGAYSPSISPSTTKGKNIVAPEYKPQIVNTNTFAPLQQGSQPFAGPSHQYDLHKQHIPLPPGALANSLAATQPRPSFAYNAFSQGFGIGSNTGLYDMNTNDEIFDFNSVQGHNPSFSASNDMDMDFDSPVEGVFSNGSEFIDPNAIGGQEDASPTPTRAEVVRAYPGMHAHQAQQAALAKQQQQIEIQRQQQQRAAQRPQSTSSHKPSSSRSGGSRPPVDPAVEERISRLLNQMRQSSVAGSDGNGSKQSPQPTQSKPKKDEEDMDEDERLLASEEGKKLSSKERRQLRNKVSARAFRSRRKEYIGQLEGEVAVKATEADNLRAECEALKAENSRLTDLTKLLLSSSAFSTFLNDLSTNGLPPSLGQASTQEPSQPTVSREADRGRQQYQMQQQSNAQTSMVTIPESHMDFSGADSISNNWNTGIDFNYNPQIFALTEVPQPTLDSIDTDMLSGKSEKSILPKHSTEKKDSVPTIETPPSLVKEEPKFICREDVEVDESDPAFALFADAPSTPKPSEPVYHIFGPIDFEKAVERFDIVVEDEPLHQDGVVSSVTLARFEMLCTSLDSLCEELEDLVIRS